MPFSGHYAGTVAETGDGYGEFVKLRDRLQMAGFSIEDADKVLIEVMGWCHEMASTANRSRKPVTEHFVRQLTAEELPHDGVPPTFDAAAQKLIRPPKIRTDVRVP